MQLLIALKKSPIYKGRLFVSVFGEYNQD